MGAGLRYRVLRGGAWLVAADIAARSLGLIKVAILARFLTPQDFGMIGVVGLVVTWFDYFSQTGFSLALVRKQEDISPYLNTFWTVQALRGLLLAGIIVAASPLLAWIFHDPALIPLISIGSLVVVFRGLSNPAIVYIRKDLKIEREVLWKVGGALVGLIVALPMVFVWRNVWTLVISVIAGNFAELVLSYLLVRFRPRFELHWARARELMRFGKWIFWSNIATYLNTYADIWVIGRHLGAASIGYYQFGQQFGGAPLSQAGNHISAVTFPAFSQFTDQAALRRAFLRSFRLVSVVMLPAGAAFAVFSPLIVRVALGQKWMPVAPLLAMLACGGAFMALGSVVRAFLQAVDRPRLAAQGLFLRFLIFAALVYPLMHRYGVAGVALASLISTPLSFLYQYFEAGRLLAWDWDLLWVFRHGLLGCLPFLAAAVFMPFSVSLWSTALLAAAALLAFAAYLWRQLRILL